MSGDKLPFMNCQSTLGGDKKSTWHNANHWYGHVSSRLTPLRLLFWTVGTYLIIYRAEETPVEIVAGIFAATCAGERMKHQPEIFGPALPRAFHAARVQRSDLAKSGR